MKLIAGTFGSCVSGIGIVSDIDDTFVAGGIDFSSDFGSSFCYSFNNNGKWNVNEIVTITLDFNADLVIIKKGNQIIVDDSLDKSSYCFVFAPCDCNKEGGIFEILDE